MTDLEPSKQHANLPLGVIMIGGDSHRMGQPKAQLRLGGQSLLERATNAIAPQCSKLASQMMRWGQASPGAEVQEALASSFRTDLFRRCADEEGIRYPRVDHVVEGAHDESWPLDEASAAIAMPGDRFMDRRSFDLTDLQSYVDSFEISGRRARAAQD